MGKKKRIAIVITSILIALNLIFIWGNSCLNTSTSLEGSNAVFDTVKPVFDATFGKDVITLNVFRKTAHFVEFCCFGFLINLLYLLIYGVNKSKLSQIFSIGLFVAVIDESLQILSNRGASVQDVLLDYAGYAFGVAFLFLCFLIYKSIRKKLLKTT